MSNFDEKSGTVEVKTPTYRWFQTIEEVTVFVPVPTGTRGRDISCDVKRKHITMGLKGQPPLVNGELSGDVKEDDTLWSLEDQEVRILLTKAHGFDTWTSLVKGEYEIDPLTLENNRKKMMLERFQRENPGFDFSGADFSGAVPSDMANFMRK